MYIDRTKVRKAFDEYVEHLTSAYKDEGKVFDRKMNVYKYPDVFCDMQKIKFSGSSDALVKDCLTRILDTPIHHLCSRLHLLIDNLRAMILDEGSKESLSDPNVESALRLIRRLTIAVGVGPVLGPVFDWGDGSIRDQQKFLSDVIESAGTGKAINNIMVSSTNDLKRMLNDFNFERLPA